MKILSFPYPQVVSNLYEFLFSAKHKIRLKNMGYQTIDGPLWMDPLDRKSRITSNSIELLSVGKTQSSITIIKYKYLLA